MPHLYDFDKAEYGTLLASTVLDASKGELFRATGLAPDTTNRTILIGVGGTGVRTVDYVKGAISKKLNASWSRYVGFLALDASWTELDNAAYLDHSEKEVITKDGVASRMASPATFPAAVRPFLDESVRLGNLQGDGAGRTRLQGKVKLHDAPAGGIGEDQTIVGKITALINNLDPLTAAHGKYQVYIIGSVSGGTGSGTFLEMPALVRRAFASPDQVSVNAIMYLPDTLAMLDPQNESQLYANGYAALKELDYFMGMYMRPQYEEVWTYNDPAARELAHKSDIVNENFIHIPYLVGTLNGPFAGASDTAKETIAEFLISTLAQLSSTAAGGMFLTSAFDSNARSQSRVGLRLMDPGNPNREAAGEYHEFPKRYAAIGYAKASAPEKLVRAYTVGKVCDMIGLKPVAKEERAARSGGILPFRAADDLMKASEGTQKAMEVVAPIAGILGLVHSGSFNFVQILNQEVTWRRIKQNELDNQFIMSQVDGYVANATDSRMMSGLEQAVRDAFAAYRNNVKNFVRVEGPNAFVNLYQGRFTEENGNHGIGIRDMIRNLVEGRTTTGLVYQFKTVADAANELAARRRVITETNINVFNWEAPGYKTQAAEWQAAFEAVQAARINEARRKIALGPNGTLQNAFQIPAENLAREIDAFGALVESLAGIYTNHGDKMEAFQTFRTARDNETEVNLAAVSPQSYDWLKQQADAALATVNAAKMRDNLVEAFFSFDEHGQANAAKWLEVPENQVSRNAVTHLLTLNVPDQAVPGRQIFDKFMAENFPATVSVSIETMFKELQSQGVSYSQTAHDTIQQLYSRSRPLFNGDIPGGSLFGYIMYPAALNNGTGEGPKIAQALEQEAKNVCPNVQIYASDDTDGIVFYQLAAPMEIYRLKELSKWEDQYEKGMHGISNRNAYLHSMSPDVSVKSDVNTGTVYTENIPWINYPGIVPSAADERKPDPRTGEVSREGKILLDLDRLIARARELGVLYSEQNGSSWTVKRVNCDKSVNWRFDLMECIPDPVTGMLPLGRKLAEAVASQNHVAMDLITRKVALELGGLMDAEYPTEEMAWEYAARILRRHMPMMIEVRETVARFEQWAEAIEGFNATARQQWLPAKLIWLLKAQILRRDDTGLWTYVRENGTSVPVANLTPVMMNYMQPKDKYLIENGLLGYYLYSKLMDKIGSVKDFDAAYERAKKVIDRLINDMEMDALQAGEELAKTVLDEREALAAKGARFDGDANAEPRSAFAKEFPGIRDMAVLKDIDIFYFRVGLWAEI